MYSFLSNEYIELSRIPFFLSEAQEKVFYLFFYNFVIKLFHVKQFEIIVSFLSFFLTGNAIAQKVKKKITDDNISSESLFE